MTDNIKGWDYVKLTKDEFLSQLMTRREAESYLQLSQVAFQYHLRNENIKPCKEHGRGNAKVQLFWLDDLKELETILK